MVRKARFSAEDCRSQAQRLVAKKVTEEKGRHVPLFWVLSGRRDAGVCRCQMAERSYTQVGKPYLNVQPTSIMRKPLAHFHRLSGTRRAMQYASPGERPGFLCNSTCPPWNAASSSSHSECELSSPCYQYWKSHVNFLESQIWCFWGSD